MNRAACAAVLCVIALGVPASAAACGTERWPVKTLTDARAGEVDLHPTSTSVSALRGLASPADPSQRVRGVETTTYRVRVRLLAAKNESDGDIHLVVSDPRRPGATMIVEFPASECIVHARASGRMVRARTAFAAACRLPRTSSFAVLNGAATISGVGFFDFKHGQRGVAPNAIELHPALGFHGAGGPPIKVLRGSGQPQTWASAREVSRSMTASRSACRSPKCW